ncbi:MAG: hypothetical protein KF734_10660 [Saprospiraceae bacterium]|nr:hypothetical protein [Saprospiraceae bacterium]
MKKTLLLPILATALLFSSCDRAPFPLRLAQFDVRWFDDDASGTHTPDDYLQFAMRVVTTAPDPDDQFITDWEFAYYVNGAFGGVLQSDRNLRSNSVTLDAGITIKNLSLPRPGPLKPGDVIEFQFWAKDNWGEHEERRYRYMLEP